ncbi:D-alanyl-D-alanine carboxypeptidase [Pontibacter litorisediminis]|uniref:D-alanyl-D-alanine carboxypeptidase n=1 Tax=Pontibacter litorisediminis TaxID=1846260 RepID=UPI0023EC2067|nr:D-alanyl-D-alanine carboxypeptidase [Pontibacter litorisediminis]
MYFTKSIHRWAVLSSLVLAVACSGKVPTASKEAARFGPAEIRREVAESEVLRQSFVGFALFDPELGQMVVEHNADKYFVPASNTKLFTFYASHKMLGDSLAALKYVSRGDSLIFWGTGDPTFTHMDLKNTLAYDFLKNRPEKKLYYIDAPFTSTPFATNWGWDDYNYYYQPERNIFPIHGNVIKFHKEEAQPFTTTPAYFEKSIVVDTAEDRSGTAFVRAWRENRITYHPRYASEKFSTEVPFITSPEMVVTLLADTLQREVELLKAAVPEGGKIFYGLPTDTVLRRMLQVSDNLMAEQLMALCSGTLSDTLSVERAIKHVKETYLADLPDEPIWIDGSGLSSMNMFTPRSIIALLQKLMQERPEERLLPMLAIGGRPGTFRSIYQAEVPFVFGKSGTLAHVHNQSGFIRTKSGKLLLYSFMNNNYKVPTAAIRNEMVRIMTEVHNRY